MDERPGDEAARVELRAYRPQDAETVAEIWHAAAALPGVGPPTALSLGDFRAMVDTSLVPSCRIVLAVRGEAVLGFLAIRPADRVLDQLFLRPDRRGGGIGRLLLAQAQQAMPDGFTLVTRPGNAPACRFYEAAGLVRLGEEVHPRFRDAIVVYGWTPAGGGVKDPPA